MCQKQEKWVFVRIWRSWLGSKCDGQKTTWENLHNYSTSRLFPVCSCHYLSKWSKVETVMNQQQGNGQLRLTDAHGEQRVAHVVRSNKWATVTQIAEEVNTGLIERIKTTHWAEEKPSEQARSNGLLFKSFVNMPLKQHFLTKTSRFDFWVMAVWDVVLHVLSFGCEFLSKESWIVHHRYGVESAESLS